MTTEEFRCLGEIFHHIGGLMDFSDDKEAFEGLSKKVNVLQRAKEKT